MAVTSNSRMGHPVLFPLLAVGLGLLVFLFCGEILIRLLIPLPQWRFLDARIDWQVDPEIGWVQKGNISSKHDYGEFGWTISFRTNPDGLLPSTTVRPKDPGIFRILILGDSTVVGRAVPEENRIHVRLQARLRERGRPAEVINAGVQGYSTDQELLWMKRLLPLYKPDLILLSVCQNDFDANRSKKAMGISKPLFHVKDGKIVTLEPPDLEGLRIRMEDPFRFSRLIQRSALYSFFRPQIFLLRERFGLVDNEDILLGGPSRFYGDAEFAGTTDFDTCEGILKEMKKTAEEHGARFAFFSHPHLEEVWDPHIAMIEKRFRLKEGQYDRYRLERKLKEIAERKGLEFCPVVDFFRKNKNSGPFHLLPRDPHCNPEGYRIMADLLADFISAKFGLMPSSGH